MKERKGWSDQLKTEVSIRIFLQDIQSFMPNLDLKRIALLFSGVSLIPSPESHFPQGISSVGIAWVQDSKDIDHTLLETGANWFTTSYNPDLVKQFPGYYIPIISCSTPEEEKVIPTDYRGTIQLFNEPNLPPPNGCPLNPQEAAKRYFSFKKSHPYAKLILGNVSVWELGSYKPEYSWLPKFLELTKADPPEIIGIHAYVEEWITKEMVKDWIYNFSSRFPNLKIFITETGICSGNTTDLEWLIGQLRQLNTIKGIAFFTDFQDDHQPWGICYKDPLKRTDGSNVSILNKDRKTLTNMGETIKKLNRQSPVR